MAQPPPYGYYYGSEADQYTFYRLPKALFTNSRYKGLSDGAKILYGLMLDRMGLSMKNGWLDEQNRVYIYFTLEDVQEYMNCQRDKGMKLLAELDTAKGVGLIERVKQGLGKPTIIYVRKFFEATDLQTSEKPTSGLPDLPTSAHRQNRPLDVDNPDPNKNKISNPDFNENNHSDTDYPTQSYPAGTSGPAPQSGLDGIGERNAYRELIRENVEYDCLCERYGQERMDEIVELLTDTVCSKREYITISSDDYPAQVVKSRLLKIHQFHVEYVLDCMSKNTTKVRNIKKYLLAALYNAPATMDSY